MIRVKRIYDHPSKEDGFRILVDRLWPRGLSKDKAKVDLWLRDIAPSDGLRKWFSHDPEKWEEFRRKYKEELKRQKVSVDRIRQLENEKGIVTLLYSAREEKYNNAGVLAETLQI